ncbi:hypothetical protein BC834DRAFT_845559 [Gloeopeniophorella convolvens]|nr:hypothetical protein BC834DRAFT_845559 [Gloeopeniophorella convolvens]
MFPGGSKGSRKPGSLSVLLSQGVTNGDLALDFNRLRPSVSPTLSTPSPSPSVTTGNIPSAMVNHSPAPGNGSNPTPSSTLGGDAVPGAPTPAPTNVSSGLMQPSGLGGAPVPGDGDKEGPDEGDGQRRPPKRTSPPSSSKNPRKKKKT